MITETRNTLFGLEHSVSEQVRRSFNELSYSTLGRDREQDDLLSFLDEFEAVAYEIAESFVPLLNSNILWTASDSPNRVCYPEDPDPDGDPISTIRQGILEVLQREAGRECRAIRSRILDGVIS